MKKEHIVEMTLAPGQTLNIAAVAQGDQIKYIFSAAATPVAPTKRGPKSLPKSAAKSTDFHAAILKSLKKGPKTANDIRAAINATPEDKNVISWALVEMQNEGSRRSKTAAKTGPVVKLDDGRYTLRSKLG